MVVNRVQGLDAVLSRLNSTIGEIEGASVAGLLEGGLIVQRTAQQRAPVDTGNLKGSAYTRKQPGNDKAVEVGFTAAYAVFVHESMEMKLKGTPRTGGTGKGTYWGTGQPKFLESALNDHERDIVDAVRKHAKVKE